MNEFYVYFVPTLNVFIDLQRRFIVTDLDSHFGKWAVIKLITFPTKCASTSMIKSGVCLLLLLLYYPLSPSPPSYRYTAVRHPLIDIGFPDRPPVAAAKSVLDPLGTRGLNQIIWSTCWWTSYTSLADPHSPFKNISATTTSHSCYMAHLLPLERANSVGYVSISGCSTWLFMSYSIS